VAKGRQEGQGAVCSPQAFFAPADARQAKVVPPVVGLERHCTSRGRARVEAVASPIEDEPKRCPCFGGLRIQPACFACVPGREYESSRVWRRVGARHFELHNTGVGEADVR